MFSWGLGTALGCGTARSQSSPTEVTELSHTALSDHVVKVACGGGFSAAITSEGALYTWGKWANGRLGALS